MTYGWARDFSLQLINQYSVAGTAVAMGYNNQADYILRIPALLDDAQTYVATSMRKIRTLVPISTLQSERSGNWMVYTLPKDCWQVMSGGLVRFTGKRLQRYHNYHLLGNNQIAVPVGVLPDMSLEYYRRPVLLGKSPSDDTELDNTVEVQMALPYYVAAHLVMYDNPFAYGSLSNEFDAKLAFLSEVPQTECTIVEDAYSAEEWEENG